MVEDHGDHRYTPEFLKGLGDEVAELQAARDYARAKAERDYENYKQGNVRANYKKGEEATTPDSGPDRRTGPRRVSKQTPSTGGRRRSDELVLNNARQATRPVKEEVEPGLAEGSVYEAEHQRMMELAGMAPIVKQVEENNVLKTLQTIGRAAQNLPTRDSVRDEISQELRNFIRAQGGDPTAQNLSTLHGWQKKLEQDKQDKPDVKPPADGDIPVQEEVVYEDEHQRMMELAGMTPIVKGVAEGFPQPGPSSGAPKQFGPDAKIQTRQMTVTDIISSVPGVPYYNNVVDDWDAKDYSWGVTKKVIEYATYLKDHPESLAKLPPAIVLNGKFEDGAHRVSAIWLLQQRMDPKNPLWKNAKLNVQFVKQGVAEGAEHNNLTADKIFFARSNKTPKGWSYDHVGFITQDGKQIQMSGHKGNDVYVTNSVTDDPEFPKQNIKIVSLSKPVSVPTTNLVGAENCGTFVANVLQANGIKGIDTQKIYSVFKQSQKQGVAEGSVYEAEHQRMMELAGMTPIVKQV